MAVATAPRNHLCIDFMKYDTHKLVMQDAKNTCGIACVRMILAHLALSIDPSLWLSYRQSDSTLSLTQLKEILGLFCVEVEAVQLRIDWLFSDDGNALCPFIMHINANHFVVVYHCCHAEILISDPLLGNRRYKKPSDCSERESVANCLVLCR